MAGPPTDPGSDGSFDDPVLVSNRGPLPSARTDGRPVRSQAAGGLAGSLHPMVAGTGATWVACALGEADRAAADQGSWWTTGSASSSSTRTRTSTGWPTTWSPTPPCGSATTTSSTPPADPGPTGGGRRRGRPTASLNQLFAERVAKVAPEGGRVLVQDYHLALVGSELARLRPDLRTVHFTHTPFADPSVLRMLPDAAGDELLAAMAGFGACGFHTERWAAGLPGLPPGAQPRSGPSAPTFVSGSAPDPDRLLASIGRARRGRGPAPASRTRSAAPTARSSSGSTGWSCPRTCCAGSGPSRSSWTSEPAWRERVVFVALAYPTRQGLAEYLAYQNEVESTVARINERWGTPGWTPIVLEVEDDYPRSLAALTRYDVLLVNPIRDGMNLVAKEGPWSTTSDGVLALSREAGAFEELAGPSLEVNPFDVGGHCRGAGPGPGHAGRWAGGRGQVTPGAGHGQEPDRLARRSARAG